MYDLMRTKIHNQQTVDYRSTNLVTQWSEELSLGGWEESLEEGGFELAFEKGLKLEQVDKKGTKFVLHS